MKLLADIICNAAPNTPFPVCRKMADLLRAPSPNHAPGDFATPMVERFVFGQAEADALWGLVKASVRNGQVSSVRLPLPEFWLEMPHDATKIGYWARPDDVGGAQVAVFLEYPALGAYPFFQFTIDAEGIPSSICDLIVDRSALTSLTDQDLRKLAARYVVLFEGAMMAITRTVRMASTRRTHRYEGFPNISVATRRAAQRGMPVYSFNEVKFAFPRNSIQRGSVRQSASDSVRGHWVISHWRQIGEGTVDAQFVWIAGHKRGNEELGFVTKQRNFNTTKHAARGLPPGVKGAFGVAV